jgi:hypothetical protein
MLTMVQAQLNEHHASRLEWIIMCVANARLRKRPAFCAHARRAAAGSLRWRSGWAWRSCIYCTAARWRTEQWRMKDDG